VPGSGLSAYDLKGTSPESKLKDARLKGEVIVTPLERITKRVTRIGHPDDESTPRPLLTLAEFFEGNHESGSIGCNLLPVPAPKAFYDLFRAMALRGHVSDIRVQITQFDAPEWPFTDTVYVMTTATEEEVMSWFPKSMKPDETWRGFVEQAYESYVVPSGMHPIGCWWD
jgi:hypothetical protein